MTKVKVYILTDANEDACSDFDTEDSVNEILRTAEVFGSHVLAVAAARQTMRERELDDKVEFKPICYRGITDSGEWETVDESGTIWLIREREIEVDI